MLHPCAVTRRSMQVNCGLWLQWVYHGGGYSLGGPGDAHKAERAAHWRAGQHRGPAVRKTSEILVAGNGSGSVQLLGRSRRTFPPTKDWILQSSSPHQGMLPEATPWPLTWSHAHQATFPVAIHFPRWFLSYGRCNLFFPREERSLTEVSKILCQSLMDNSALIILPGNSVPVISCRTTGGPPHLPTPQVSPAGHHTTTRAAGTQFEKHCQRPLGCSQRLFYNYFITQSSPPIDL